MTFEVEALEKALELLDKCEEQGADGGWVQDLRKILNDALLDVDEESNPKVVQVSDRTIEEVARVLMQPSWVVRERFDECARTLCERASR
jgi:hypothetical protein